MTHKTHSIAIMLSIASLSALILMAILVAYAWLNAGPILDMRL
ncbi:hypothetical protein [Phyllobacterium salinisoli]|nr:hypothetical protein [Phyllobacterium salinisoli]